MAGKSKKSVAPQGKFAQIPVKVSKSVLALLSATEFRVWFSLCLQCQHWANGTGMLCRSVIREFHLGSQRDVTAATKRLIDTKHIVRTREAVQRKSALFGVTHLPLNVDAMAKQGLSDSDIRAALKLFAEARSASDSGSASSGSKVEALNPEIDISGSTKQAKQPLALPKTGGFASESASQRYHPGTRLKNLPCPDPDSARVSGPQSDAVHPPSPAPFSRRVRVGKQTPAEIISDLLLNGWTDAQIHEFAAKQKLSISLDDIRAARIRA